MGFCRRASGRVRPANGPTGANEAAESLGIAVGRSPMLAFEAGEFLVQRPPLDSEDLCGLRFIAACLLKDAKNLAPLHFVQFPARLIFLRVPRLLDEERPECLL